MPTLHQVTYRATVQESQDEGPVLVTLVLRESIGLTEFDQGGLTVSISLPPGAHISKATALAEVLNRPGLRLAIAERSPVSLPEDHQTNHASC